MSDFGYNIALGVVIAAAWATRMIIRTKHQLRVARSRLAIAKCVTKKHRLMMEAVLEGGVPCDTTVFLFMYRSQFANTRNIARSLLRSPSKEAVEFRELLLNEMSKDNGKYAPIIRKFVIEEFRLFRFSRPCLYWVYVVWSLILRRAHQASDIPIDDSVRGWARLNEKWGHSYLVAFRTIKFPASMDWVSPQAAPTLLTPLATARGEADVHSVE